MHRFAEERPLARTPTPSEHPRSQWQINVNETLPGHWGNFFLSGSAVNYWRSTEELQRLGNTLPTSAGNSAVVPITCTVTTPSVSVSLPTVALSALSSVGSTAGDTRFDIGLSCASGANVYITLSDATTSSNTSSLLTLATDSTAQGIKLRFFNSTGLANFGPDSAAAGTTHQWFLGASSRSSVGNVPLTVQYYRDDTNPAGTASATLSAGSVHALATFTMSYQ